MEKKVYLDRNRIYHLENSVITYGIYNAETVVKIVDTIHKNAQQNYTE